MGGFDKGSAIVHFEGKVNAIDLFFSAFEVGVYNGIQGDFVISFENFFKILKLFGIQSGVFHSI